MYHRYGVGFRCRLDPHETELYWPLMKKYCDGEIPLTAEEVDVLKSIASPDETLDALLIETAEK